MKKDEYLETLKQHLSPLPHQVREEILQEQRMHLEAAIGDGRDESEAVASMGDAASVAKSYRAYYRIESAQKAEGFKESLAQGLRALFAVLVLTPFNLIFVMIPVLLIGFALGLLLMTGAALFVGGLGASVYLPFELSIDWGIQVGLFLMGISLACFAVTWICLFLLLTHSAIQALLSYLRFNLKFIQGNLKG